MTHAQIEIAKLNWSKVNGLLPVIIQNYETGCILMLGYMNEDALQKTCQTGTVTFYSRTKNRLWTKGETSGHELTVVYIAPDCDQDTLLIQVKPKGPCCHLNKPSCFGDAPTFNSDILSKLNARIESRFHKRQKNSYIAKLFAEGLYKIAQKVGEEGVEVSLAAVSCKKDNIINESADLLFHLLILLKQSQIEWGEILSELERRYRLSRE